VADELAQATELFQTYTPAEVGELKGQDGRVGGFAVVAHAGLA
jgi:hypothetical protein